MGQRMPPIPHVYGRDCLLGFDAGKTPEFLYTRFSLIVKCPDVPPIFYPQPPNDRMFKLTQLFDYPCNWWYYGDDWTLWFYLSPTGPLVRFELRSVSPAKLIFWSETAGPLDEGSIYTNISQDCVPGRAAKDGIATVTWTHEATDLLELINMERAYDLFMELFPLEDGKKVYKFCRLEDSTNIKILYEA